MRATVAATRTKADREVGSDRWIIAIDIGGTFTDGVAISGEGMLEVTKVPSTPHDPSLALVSAIDELSAAGVPLDRVSAIFHGTTVATNAVLTGNLGDVTLIGTEGYRDILGYRDGGRPLLYDLQQPRPRELVRRRNRLEAKERLAWNGDVVTPLTQKEVRRILDQVAALRPDAIAVCFLFSYMNDAHEQQLGHALAERFPEMPVTLSSDIAREFREYPRTATTALNAALRPIVGRYLVKAETSIRGRGVAGPFLIMQSNGGSVPAARADRESHRLLLSGPTAGVAGTIAAGARIGVDRLISMDMGGTSLDVCLIRDGVPPVIAREQVYSHPILAPSVDVVTVGAGGGSIARVDAAGRLRVGPASAGADPGPAAYGRGGTQATITDAHVVMGTLGTEGALADRIKLDRAASLEVVGAVAVQLGLDVEATSTGIVSVALAHMVRALRRVSVERGVDPSGFTLVAFGGAGPLHAAQLLREMNLESVLVPPHPGLFSAAGLVATDLRVDESQTVLRTAGSVVFRDVAAWYRAATRRMTSRLREDGIDDARIRLIPSIDCRYLGQGFELSVPLRGIDPAALVKLREDFQALHDRTYGHVAPDEEVELVTLRLSGFGGLERPGFGDIQRGGREPAKAARTGTRSISLPGERRRRSVGLFRRELLRAGNLIHGPAVIEEMDSTTVLLAGQVLHVDRFGSLRIREARP
ncbi:MAG: hydantoinase/oxoprolinase family protein [Actinomycetota bacterium]